MVKYLYQPSGAAIEFNPRDSNSGRVELVGYMIGSNTCLALLTVPAGCEPDWLHDDRSNRIARVGTIRYHALSECLKTSFK